MGDWTKPWILDGCIRPVIDSDADADIILKIVQTENFAMNKLISVNNTLKAVGDINNIIKLVVEHYQLIQNKTIAETFLSLVKKNIIPITFIEDNNFHFFDPLMLFTTDTQNKIFHILYFEPFAKQVDDKTVEIEFILGKSKLPQDIKEDINFTYQPNLAKVKSFLPKNLDIYKEKELSKKNKLRIDLSKFENSCLYGKQIKEIFGFNIDFVLTSIKTNKEFKAEDEDGYNDPPEQLPEAPKLE